MLDKPWFKQRIIFLYLVGFDLVSNPHLLEEILDFPELVPQFSVTVVGSRVFSLPGTITAQP
jgi:hypothetical protein